MEKTNNYITPIVESNIKIKDNRLFYKRDDLLPFSFGGNKARIAQEFFADMKVRKSDCIIGYGNARSNLSRVIANIAKSRGVKCYIISPADDDGNRQETNNSLITKWCDAEIVECNKNNVAQTVEEIIAKCKQPYYIYGDKYGHGNEVVPVRAYNKTYKEILQQEKQMKVKFDYIFLASGTGMTQSGLITGMIEKGDSKRIVGISVARKNEQQIEVIKNYVNKFLNQNNLVDVEFVDSYLCGGYGKYNKDIGNTIKNIMIKDGVPLDVTYTGKAFYGMKEYIKQKGINNSNILFLHTGGTPIFFDNIKQRI